MRRILIIDDDQLDGTPLGSVRAYDHVEAINRFIERRYWDEVWFDHDLGQKGDARKVMTYLEERRQSGNPVLIEAVYVHSMNPVGASELVAGLSKMYPTRRVPLPWKRTTRPGAHHAR